MLAGKGLPEPLFGAPEADEVQGDQGAMVESTLSMCFGGILAFFRSAVLY